MVANTRLTGNQRGFAHLGTHPDSVNSEDKSKKPTIEYFWVGLEVVQKRNIRKKTNFEKGETELVYNPEPEKWSSPIYLVLQRSITMPPLGESLFLNEWTARRLLEQMPEGSLLTASQGGQAVAEYLKEQITSGVLLPDISKGKFGLQKRSELPEGATLGEMFGNLEDDEIRKIFEERGLSITHEEFEESVEEREISVVQEENK